jgi:hypothetical protein
MPSYTCICCGHTEEFETAGAAYEAGWDVEPLFTVQPLCVLCPAAPVAMHGLEAAQARHSSTHLAWQRDGRPELFDTDAELRLDFPDEEAFKRAKEGLAAFKEAMKPKVH